MQKEYFPFCMHHQKELGQDGDREFGVPHLIVLSQECINMLQLNFLLGYLATLVKGTVEVHLSSNSCECYQFKEVKLIKFVVLLNHISLEIFYST